MTQLLKKCKILITPSQLNFHSPYFPFPTFAMTIFRVIISNFVHARVKRCIFPGIFNNERHKSVPWRCANWHPISAMRVNYGLVFSCLVYSCSASTNTPVKTTRARGWKSSYLQVTIQGSPGELPREFTRVTRRVPNRDSEFEAFPRAPNQIAFGGETRSAFRLENRGHDRSKVRAAKEGWVLRCATKHTGFQLETFWPFIFCTGVSIDSKELDKML